MSLGEIGALFLFVVIVFIVGNCWFALVEGSLSLLKRLFLPKSKPAAWHPYPEEETDKKET